LPGIPVVVDWLDVVLTQRARSPRLSAGSS
jgi:hypothetical protein